MRLVDTGRVEILRNENLTPEQALFFQGFLNGRGIRAHRLLPSNTLGVPADRAKEARELFENLDSEIPNES